VWTNVTSGTKRSASKDTVAGALGQRRDAGIVVAEQPRDPAGTFTTGSYRIVVPACFRLTDHPASTSSKLVSTGSQSRPRPLASRAIVAQRSLLDPGPPAS
jgi:hypothetical protein